MLHVVGPPGPETSAHRSFTGRTADIHGVAEPFRRFNRALRGDDVEIERMADVARQIADGRTGGGPKCPWCGERALAPMENDRRRQCGNCGRGAELIVTNGRLEIQKRTIKAKVR